MIFASGVFANSPNSDMASPICWSFVRKSLKDARIRLAKLISRVSTSMPALAVKALTMGNKL